MLANHSERSCVVSRVLPKVNHRRSVLVGERLSTSKMSEQAVTYNQLKELLQDYKEETKKELRECLENVNRKLEGMEERMNWLEEENQSLRDALRVQEDRDRRKNLIIFGVPEEQEEDCRGKAIEVFEKYLNVKMAGLDIERAHRLFTRSQPRPIIDRFERHLMRETIWKGRRSMPMNLRISEDFSFATIWARKQLQPIASKAREDGKYPFFVVDKLLVGDYIYRYNSTAERIEHQKRKVGDNKRTYNERQSQREPATTTAERGRPKRKLAASPGSRTFSSPIRRHKLNDIRTFYKPKNTTQELDALEGPELFTQRSETTATGPQNVSIWTGTQEE